MLSVSWLQATLCRRSEGSRSPHHILGDSFCLPARAAGLSPASPPVLSPPSTPVVLAGTQKDLPHAAGRPLWPRARTPHSEHLLLPPTRVACLLPPSHLTDFRPRSDPGETPASLGFPARHFSAGRDRPGRQAVDTGPFLNKRPLSLARAAPDPAPERTPRSLCPQGGGDPRQAPGCHSVWGLQVLLCPMLLSGLSPCMPASSSQSSFLPEGAPDGPDFRLVFSLPPQGPTA